MIIRVRNNLGTWKISLEETSTLDDLKEAIAVNYKLDRESIALGKEISVAEPFMPDTASLSSLGINAGDLVFLAGRLEKEVVESSYIGKDGNIVSAGVRIVKASEKQPSGGISLCNHGDSVEVKAQLQEKNEAPKSIEHMNETIGTSNVINTSDNKTNAVLDSTDEEALSLAEINKIIQEDKITESPSSKNLRKPDQTKKMCLFDDDDNEVMQDGKGYHRYL